MSTVQDQYITLDKTFDHAVYSLVTWIHPRDSYVTRGEAIAILTDGESQYVVVAPCSGRIIATFVDAGARVLPRSIIGSIRVTHDAPAALGTSYNLIVAVGLILIALLLIPLLSRMGAPTETPAFPVVDNPQPTTTATTDTQNSTPESPFPSFDDVFGSGQDDSAAYPEPAAPDPVDPAPMPTPEVAATVAPVVPTGDDSSLSDGSSNDALTRDMLTYLEIIHSIQAEKRDYLATPVDPATYEQIVQPAITDLEYYKEQINTLVNQYTNDPALNSRNRDIFTMYQSWIQPCQTPFDQQALYVSDGTIPDADMQIYFDQCDALLDTISQYSPPE